MELPKTIKGEPLNRFVYDSKYREKTLEKIKKDCEKNHQKEIKHAQAEKDKIIRFREEEIKRLENERLDVLVKDQLAINETEGKVTINGSDVLFSDIKGAELNVQLGAKSFTSTHGKSKKSASIGGAIAGGLIGGKSGAVVGGSVLGKTKNNSYSSTSSIPTCLHLGILIDVDGFQQEVILVKNEIRQSSRAYTDASNNAQNIIMRLREVSKKPVPETYTPVDQLQEIKDIERKIQEADENLQKIINTKPEYKIPQMYRTKKQSNMADEEHLEYLKEQDEVNSAKRKSPYKKNPYLVPSFVLGIISMPLSLVLFGIIPAVIGFVSGIKEVINPETRTLAEILGTIMCAFSIGLFVLLMVSIM